MASLPRTDLIAFIDESGDFELAKIDARYPVCAQCALTCTVEEYLTKAAPNMMRLKYSFFGNECVVMHGHKIRRRQFPFHILKDDAVHSEFMRAVSWTFAQLDGALVIAAVHKPKHVAQYVRPEDPFYLSLKFLLERLQMHWANHIAVNRRLLCVFEKRGDAEDARTLVWFDKICQGDNHRRQRFHFDADFRPKSDNVIGHQYADLAAYAACRFVETGNDDRLDWQAVKGKLRTVGGDHVGHGLKVFP